jgi:hypothetical protein
MKKKLLFALLIAAAANSVAAQSLAAPATPPQADLKGLRELAVRIKQDIDTLRRGEGLDARQIDLQRHALRNFAPDAQADSREPSAQKYAAVARLLDEVEYRAQQAPAAAAARPQLDREVLAAQHGGTCASALGISAQTPVEIALGASGQTGDEAWFRLEPGTAAGYIVTTDARGADPALEILSDCAAPTAQASNDDAVGLDAQVAVRTPTRKPLLVHLTNSGDGGAVVLSVSAADATIAGRVTEAGSGQGIAFPDLNFFTSTGGNIYVSVQTDSAGNYSATLPANQYYVRASASQHVTELYPNAQCSLGGYYYGIAGCDEQHAQLVTATSGSTTSGINIALATGQRIFGTVRDQDNQAVASAQVVLMDTNGHDLENVQADQFGRYQVSTLPDGNYVLRATGNYYNSRFASQMYNHVTCEGPLLQQCDAAKANVLGIAGNDLGGIDFNLQQLASIHGHVAGPSQASVYVVTLGGQSVAQAYTNAQGNYSAGPLSVGQYYVYATSGGFFSQLHASIICGADCVSSLGSGTPIQIAQQGQSPQIDFQLTPLPVQHGHMQDAISGLPLAGVQVSASPLPPANFHAISNTVTDANGDYSLPGPQPGNYYLWAQSIDHIDQVYSGIACEQPGGIYSYSNPACDVTGAMLMTITPSTTTLPDANFALQPSSSIAGHVSLRGGPGVDIPASNSFVQIYDTAGVQLMGTYVDALGNYVASDLSPGTYFAAVNAQYGFGQIWKNIDCFDVCAPTLGTPIAVGANTAVTGVDFMLTRPDTIIGQVTDEHNVPLAGVLVDLFDANTLGYVTTAATDDQGGYLVSANLGNAYFVATEAPGNYIDQIYAGVSCPNGPAYQHQCAFAGATSVVLTYGATQPHVVNFALSLPPDEIFAATFE